MHTITATSVLSQLVRHDQADRAGAFGLPADAGDLISPRPESRRGPSPALRSLALKCGERSESAYVGESSSTPHR